MVFDENYKAAETAFNFVFNHLRSYQIESYSTTTAITNVLYQQNQKIIYANMKRLLQLLIPIKLLLNMYPSISLLKEYDLNDEFYHIIKALRNGNIELFNTSLLKNAHIFIQKVHI